MANEPANRKVVSRRVTPAGGAPVARPTRGGRKKDKVAPDHTSKRYTPPSKHDMPSPMWVPVLMFGCLAIGAIVIMLNYVGVLGAVSNLKLVIGLAFILVGIITATQYR